MPTLLSINNYFYRRDGSEAIYLDHNRLFENSGWSVIPFSMRHPRNPPSLWSDYFVEEIEFGHSYSLRDKLSRVPKVIYSLEARRKIQRLLDQVRPDIAHCHSVYHHISPSIFGVLKQAGIPIVMTLHDFKIACPAYHMFNDAGVCEQCKGGRLYKVVSNRCIKSSASLSALIMMEAVLHSVLKSYSRNIDCFIAPCQFYIDKLVEWGWPRERFVRIPNFVDEQSLQPHYTPGKPFLYFGRLAPEKGLLTLIRAAAAAKVELRMAGDGPQAELLKAEAQKLGADVTFLGHLAGPALENEIHHARATVLASECYENTPVSVLESFACGKPVIGSHIGGIPELVQTGMTGWTFPSGSVSALSEALLRVWQLTDCEVRQMGQRARALVEAEHGIQRYQERISTLYRSLQ